MREVRLFIDVKGDPPAGLTAPIYSLDVVKTELFAALKKNGWSVVRYGDLTEDGAFMCYTTPEPEQHQRRLERTLQRLRGDAVRRSLKGGE